MLWNRYFAREASRSLQDTSRTYPSSLIIVIVGEHCFCLLKASDSRFKVELRALMIAICYPLPNSD